MGYVFHIPQIVLLVITIIICARILNEKMSSDPRCQIVDLQAKPLLQNQTGKCPNLKCVNWVHITMYPVAVQTQWSMKKRKDKDNTGIKTDYL